MPTILFLSPSDNGLERLRKRKLGSADHEATTSGGCRYTPGRRSALATHRGNLPRLQTDAIAFLGITPNAGRDQWLWWVRLLPDRPGDCLVKLRA